MGSVDLVQTTRRSARDSQGLGRQPLGGLGGLAGRDAGGDQEGLPEEGVDAKPQRSSWGVKLGFLGVGWRGEVRESDRCPGSSFDLFIM